MELEELLRGRLGRRDIEQLCERCLVDDDFGVMEALLRYALRGDDRVGYNALWVLTHVGSREREWLLSKRNEVIDALLGEVHTGKRRLMLTVLERQAISAEDVRGDYVDFCLQRINSLEPYGVRALCVKEAFKQCRFFPELMKELEMELDMMDCVKLSPAMISVRGRVLKQIKNQPRWVSRLK